ncbi:phosphoglycolate phosphatase [Paenibacillus sp. JCM 10914]|uniref:Cof-type HAD-IIB family hydrolase n=1 Tax=Paenibacillus sp. JCM 10914 TaxID=1236974 RepID=UPI0003CCB585|nr:Cof-type HAD-IIB family hydrolase [Paenibacillus sp. JCM 10914]GAE08124.1 HAD-superfamily hydrolase [Paenibacillus sp. JCM 10914]
MNPNYRLLALDMDGTLLQDDHEISVETVKWIKEAVRHGVHVCLSTGRAFANAYPYAKQLELTTPMVTVNGSEVWRAPYDLYQRSLLDVKLVEQMHALAVETGSWFWAYSVERLHNPEQWTDDVAGQEWLKFGYSTKDDETRHTILMRLQDMGGLEITNSSPINLEINPLGVNKATGIGQVCELLGITMEQVVAVGDSLNDLAVIQQAGLGVAMGNAQETVKDEADIVVSSNNDDGIVEVIRDYILTKG